ncbi:alpha/beta fold hydrolase [Modestobacter sp. Leaf380]|uniref:alpha/beta fold hydrolase n=1 Tax=Modestobacter sp. Leaf380 TaxID=1736356 RepID=UPI0006FCCEB9|nr:alpha/beta fold hydrolase [Modestobacter sp. Leaf380]KQS71308.1 hypothetical protein ASG41_20080 [Modestobacter sp. Leaf380]
MQVATVDVNGARLRCWSQGEGPPVLLLAPAASRAALWDLHQVPALIRAGYRVVTFDHRGTPPCEGPAGSFRLADLVADAAGLIGALGLGPCRIAGSSLGAMVAQELALVRPDLVVGMALLGTRARTTHFLDQLTVGTAALVRASADDVAPRYAATTGMALLFGRRTLADDDFTRQWLELAMTFPVHGAGPAAQYEAAHFPSRLDRLTAVEVPTLVLAFTEDLLTPPALCREVADAIGGARYVELAGLGHFGFLEQPEVVNEHLVEFFGQLA